MTKWIKNEWRKYDFVYAILILIIAFSAYLGFGSAFSFLNNTVAQQFLAGAFAALFAVLIVGFLIRIQRGKDHEQKVFEAKIELYKFLINRLEEMILTADSISMAKIVNKMDIDLIRLFQIAEDKTIKSFNDILDFTHDRKSTNEDFSFSSDEEARKEIIKKMKDFAECCRAELGLHAGVRVENFESNVNNSIVSREDTKQRDYTKYILKLKNIDKPTDSLNKRQTVLNIMKYLISEQIMSPEEIEELGSKKYGNNLRLLEHFELPADNKDVSMYVRSELDKKKIDQTRYFTDSEDIIKKPDIKKVFVVSNQWGSGNLPNFLIDIENKYGKYVNYSEVKTPHPTF